MSGLRRMMPFVKPYRMVIFWLVITVIIPVIMELAVPRLLRVVIDEGIEPGNMGMIIRGSSLMLIASLFGVLATLGQGVFRAYFSQGLAYDIRNALFSHIQTFSFANLDRMQTGQLMTRISSDVDIVKMFIGSGLALLLRFLLMVVGSVVMMFLIDWQLATIMIPILFLSTILIWGVLRLAQPLYMIVQQNLGALNIIVQENLAGVQVVKAFVREKYEIDRFLSANNSYRDKNIKVGQLLAVTMPSLTLLTNIGIILILWFGGLSTINGRLSVGEFVAFTTYLLIGMAPLLILGNMLAMVSRAEASAKRVFEVLDTKPDVIQPAKPHFGNSLSGEIEFADVSFHYGNAFEKSSPETNYQEVGSGGENVLNNVNLQILPGQTIALLGTTGSGKSTLVNLISRFYDVDTGQIRVNGLDIRDWDIETLRKRIGVVFQQNTLFRGTIRENIAFGKNNAENEEIIGAAKAAQAHDFIMRLPDGYESIVEERGANLSGGQKQRIAIARALLIQPGILILDDSTSAVDLETEALIQEGVAKTMEGHTTLIIAQRISSVLAADQIIILDRGRIAAQGKHHELLAENAIYQEIFNSQLGNGQLLVELGMKNNK